MIESEWVLLGDRDPEWRYRIISIAPQLLAEIFGTGLGGYVPLETFPDLRVVAARASSWRETVDLLVQSASFAPVHNSELAPLWAPTLTSTAVAQ